jgi:hypothetical protein
MFLVLFVLHNCELVEELLDSWELTGVGGVTILHSYGLGRVRQMGLRDDVPLFPSLEQILDNGEEYSRTLFTVVDDQAKVDRVVKATQAVVGDLSLPDTGLLVVLPISQAYGLDKNWRSQDG